MMNIGFEKAATQIKKLAVEAKGKYKHIFLLGYSIGATIAWLCSNENNMCDGVIGYYGSRIRDYIEVAPKCPVLLIFPTQEKSFDVKSFVGSFKKTNVDIHILDGQHGFADTSSQNYCEHSFQKANELVHRFLQKNIT
jgi:dienelactone hydrolase